MARQNIEELRQRLSATEANLIQIGSVVDALMAMIPINSRAFYAGKLAGIRPPNAKTNRGTPAFEVISALVERLPHREWSASEIQDVLKTNGGTIVEIEQVHNVLNYLCRRERLARTSRGRYMPMGMHHALGRTEELAS